MWEKMFRKGNTMEYRKKYRCPMCNEYTLLVIHDEACECAEGCDVDSLEKSDISKIKEQNDFKGYFTSEEIKQSFWIDFDEIDKIFDEIKIIPEMFSIKSKTNKKIIDLFKKTDNIDKKLDDVVVHYFNFYGLNGIKEYQPYNYVITLVEDMHYYMNLTCKDIYLFDLSVSEVLPYKEYMYSGRFFGNNAIDHLFQANERMYVILGLICGYAFDNDLSKNTTPNIFKGIKNNTIFVTDFKETIERLKSNNFYRQLKEIRDCNEHDMSYLYKEIVSKKISDLDGNEADKQFYIPLTDNILFCLNKMFEILECILKYIDNASLYQLRSFPMYELYKQEKIKKIDKQYDIKDYRILDSYNQNIVNNIADFWRNMIILDVYFRLDEVLHCIRDIYNHYNNINTISGVDFENFIGIDYIIYSSLTRLYSCYDKIARYLKDMYKEYDKIKYFKDFKNIESKKGIQNIINSVLNNDYYKELQEIRNMVYHNLRAGIIFGEEGQKYYLDILTQIVLENERLLFELLKEIKPAKKNRIERNALCPCGSKKKYKFCHGR